MTSDVAAGASVVARLGGGAAPSRERVVRGEGESGRPINRSSLPDLWLLIVGSWRSTAHACVAIGDELGPDVARVRRLARPLPSPLRREELLHREDRPSRQHVEHRPSDLVRQDRERLPFAVLLLNAREQLLPLRYGAGTARPLRRTPTSNGRSPSSRRRCRASCRPTASVHLTSRAYEANSCTRSKRVMSWIS